MAKFTLLPDGVTGTNNWQNFGGAAADHTLVDDDDTSGFIYETRQNHEVTFTFADPSISEDDIETDGINNVTVKIKAHHTAAYGSKDLKVEQTGSGISNGDDTHSIVNNSSFPTYTGTTREYYSGTSNWTYSKLQDLQVKLTLLANTFRFQFVRVCYIEAVVDYTPAAATHNSAFFGANF